MDPIHLRSSWLKTGVRLMLAAAALVLCFALATVSAPKGLADSGGFPTRVPTNTLIPPTPTWTQPALIVANTSTPLPPAPTVPSPTVEGPLVVVATETPVPTGGGATVACLPLAIILLLGLVIGGAYFFSRRTTEEYVA